MKIAHLCLSCFYVDGFAYQENQLVQQNIADGHEVYVIASTEQIDRAGQLVFGDQGRYTGTDGAPVERLPYRRFLNRGFGRKLRLHPGVYVRLAAIRPDVILFHGACGGELLAAGRYVRDNPHVRLYVDSHEDFVNSARGFVSKWILHYGYYRPILRHVLPQITRILPVSISCQDFLSRLYGVPDSMMEFYPLGGDIIPDGEYEQLRTASRDALGLQPDDVLIVQSGKIDRSKKLLEALKAFHAQPDRRMHFIIAGRLGADVEAQVQALIGVDSRIRFIGWQNAEELKALLCAADVYCQPGTQSATMQMAVCCRCAILLDDIPSHRPYLDENGWLVKDDATLRAVFMELPQTTGNLMEMSIQSSKLALRMLDYRILAARLYR